jgi:hypothetical protein
MKLGMLITMKSVLLLLLSLCFAGAQVVSPVPEKLREEFQLSPFYTKIVMVGDFPIVASAKVNDAALSEASVIVQSMLINRPDILTAMAKNHIRLAVTAAGERTCDMPEYADLKPKEYWNVRARGLGASLSNPAVSCGEENLLHSPGDPYSTENILVHEFAHAIHQMGVNYLDPAFDERLRKAFADAMKEGKWKGKYAADNYAEYWAEAVQSWFGTNRENDALHNHVNTRAELQEYDPAVAKLCEEVFGKNDWVYRRADDPARKDESHLKDLDRSKLTKFTWGEKEMKAYRELDSKTPKG